MGRYRNYLRTHVAETPKFLMLQLFDQDVTDIYQHVGGLQLAPKILIERKIRPREPGRLPPVAKYCYQMTAGEARQLFPGKKKKKPSQRKHQ